MSRHLDVAICILGAGPVGGTLACRLTALGMQVALVDRIALSPMVHPDFDGRAYAIAAGSRQLLMEAGIWNELSVPPHPIRGIRVSDGRIGRLPSRSSLHFSLQEASHFDAFGWMIEARSLRQTLNARLTKQPGLHVFAPAQARITPNEKCVDIQLDNGAKIRAQLVVAAEGRSSPMREEAGIPSTRILYQQAAIIFAIAHELPHHDVAVEHFLPSGPFAVLPLGPSGDALPSGAINISSVVWNERPEVANAVLAMDDFRFLREVSRRLGGHLGGFKLIGRRWRYEISAMLAHRYTGSRLVLVGDAAHGIHPIAGQGLNLGFRDVVALVDVLVAASDLGHPDVLASYELERRPDNLLMLAATDSLYRIFASNLGPVRSVRDTGISLVDKAPPLKQFFMRTAMGVKLP